MVSLNDINEREFVFPKDEYDARYQLMQRAAEIYELIELNKFLQDEDIEKTLDKALKVIANSTLPAAKAAALVNEYQSLALICKAKALSYVYVVGANAGSEASKKKSIYQTLAKEFQECAHSMKVLCKV